MKRGQVKIDRPDEGLKLRSSLIKTLIGLLVVSVVLAPRLTDLNVFYARDELAIWPWADQFAMAIWRGDLAGAFTTSDYPGIPMFWVQTLFLTVKYNLPSLFSQPLLPVDRLFTDRSLDLLAERRQAAGLFTGLQVIGAIWLVYLLFGGKVALLSAIFLGLDPFSLSEARLLRLEMISALFVCLSVLTYLLYFRRRQWWLLLLSGVMAGLGVSSKTSAGLIVPYIWLLLLLDLGFGPDQSPVLRLKRVVGDGLIWAAGAISAFWLVWPAMWVRPIEAIEYVFLRGFSQAAQRSVWGDKVFFWGEILPGDPGPYFYPVVFAFRTTPLTWIGIGWVALLLGIAAWRLGAAKIGDANSAWKPSWPVVGAALLFAYVVVVTAGLTQVISKVDRFLLLVFPIVNVLTALGIAAFIEWATRAVSRQFSSARAWLPAAAILAVLLIQLGITLPSHPYYFTYWNAWAGGGRAAVETVPVGAGEGIDLAMDYLNGQPGAAEAVVVCGASQPWCERKFKGEIFRSATYFDGQWIEADYATLYISQLQRQEYPPEIVDFFMAQEPLRRVALGGATYVWIYAVPEVSHFAGRLNDLSGLARLLGYDLSPQAPAGEGVQLQVGDSVEATVWWTNLGVGVDNLLLYWVDETGYEWGRSRVAPLPAYASIPPGQRAIAAGTAGLPIPPGTPPGLYFLKIGVIEPGGDRLAGEFTLPGETSKLIVAPGEILTDPTLVSFEKPVNRPVTPEVTLLGYTLPEQVLTVDSPAWLTLYWQATDKPVDYWINLRLVDSAGQELACWRGQPGRGYYPPGSWQPGEVIKDVWALQVDPATAIGQYNLELGAGTQAAAGVEEQSGNGPIPCSNLTADKWIELGQVEVWPQPVQYETPPMQTKLHANFGDRLILLGYDLYFDTDGGTEAYLSPYFYWLSPADAQQAFDLLLTLRAADTNQVAQEWRLPLGAGEPKVLWKAGEIFSSIYQLEAASVRTGIYHLDIALVDRNSGQVEPVTLGSGSTALSIRIENIKDKVAVRVLEQ